MKYLIVLVALFVCACAQNDRYRMSWRVAPGVKLTGSQARNFCKGRFGNDWEMISINNQQEHGMVQNLLLSENVPYIWTSGFQSGNGWNWADGSRVQNFAWSRTGGNRRPQPDNREGNENCLAVLNNVYNDGVTWHDIGCSHLKPTICEHTPQQQNNNGFRG